MDRQMLIIGILGTVIGVMNIGTALAGDETCLEEILVFSGILGIIIAGCGFAFFW